MVLIELEEPTTQCGIPGSSDIVYISGRVVLVNPSYHRSRNICELYYSAVEELVREYGIIMYADYVFNKGRHMIYGIQPSHISIDLLYNDRILLEEARIILASSITRARSLDDGLTYRKCILRPSVKALLDLKNRIKNIMVVEEIEPQYALLIYVEKFGPLLNLADTILGDTSYTLVNIEVTPTQ